jgi:hypothetical protein
MFFMRGQSCRSVKMVKLYIQGPIHFYAVAINETQLTYLSFTTYPHFTLYFTLYMSIIRDSVSVRIDK